MRRVVVTGLGIISSIGNNVQEVLASLREAKSGSVKAEAYEKLGFRCQVHGAPTYDLDTVDRRVRRFMGDGAAWNYVAITQWILGIRPTFEGLQVEPVVPSDWNGFKIERNFRGVQYEITGKRKGPGNAVQLVVEGTPIQGTVLPLPAQGVKTVQVLAWLGQ